MQWRKDNNKILPEADTLHTSLTHQIRTSRQEAVLRSPMHWEKNNTSNNRTCFPHAQTSQVQHVHHHRMLHAHRTDSSSVATSPKYWDTWTTSVHISPHITNSKQHMQRGRFAVTCKARLAAKQASITPKQALHAKKSKLLMCVEQAQWGEDWDFLQGHTKRGHSCRIALVTPLPHLY